MIYEPNTTQWQPGDYVIHDWDRKVDSLLMRVVGYDAEGLCLTRYVYARCDRHNPRGSRTLRGVLANRVVVLHDPARFGIAVPTGEARESNGAH